MTVYTGLMPGRTTLSLQAWMAPTDTQVTHLYTFRHRDPWLCAFKDTFPNWSVKSVGLQLHMFVQYIVLQEALELHIAVNLETFMIHFGGELKALSGMSKPRKWLMTNHTGSETGKCRNWILWSAETGDRLMGCVHIDLFGSHQV